MKRRNIVPGLRPPTYLNTAAINERIPNIVHFLDLTETDLRACIAKRTQVVERIRGCNEDFAAKLEWMRANRIRDDETVGEICARLTQQPGREAL